MKLRQKYKGPMNKRILWKNGKETGNGENKRKGKEGKNKIKMWYVYMYIC